MITSFFHFFKPVFLTFILIGALQATGLWKNVSGAAQMVMLKTGLLNVEIEKKKSPDDFDYSFSVKDLTGQSISFDRYKGKVLFINLWATWCGPCRAEMPGIQSLSEKLKGQPVEFI